MRTRSDRLPGAWTARLMRSLVDLLGEAIRDTTERDPFGRDPGFVAAILPLLRRMLGRPPQALRWRGAGRLIGGLTKVSQSAIRVGK